MVWNWRFSRQQGRLAALRRGLPEAEFLAELMSQGLSRDVALYVYEAISEYCPSGVRPHPQDSLSGFYGIDPDHLCDLVEDAWDKMGLARPSPRRPEVVPPVDTPTDLAMYLDRRRREAS
jgi:hypothetical protein